MSGGPYLDALRALPLGSLDTLTRGEPFVVLSPHPDDESLGMGGAIAQACAHGQHVQVIVVTDGAGSHPRSQAYPSNRLVALRKKEVEQAGEALGLPAGQLGFLNLPDTQAPSEGAAFEDAIARIAAILRCADAKTIFTTWKRDPHCDHAAVAHMAHTIKTRNSGIRVWSYPIWGWHLKPPHLVDAPAPSGLRLDISPWRSAKHAAIRAHRSQMTGLIDDDPEGFRLTEEMLAPFLTNFETFIEDEECIGLQLR